MEDGPYVFLYNIKPGKKSTCYGHFVLDLFKIVYIHVMLYFILIFCEWSMTKCYLPNTKLKLFELS